MSDKNKSKQQDSLPPPFPFQGEGERRSSLRQSNGWRRWWCRRSPIWNWRAKYAAKRRSGAGAERTAQALASLTRTLQTIRAMRGEAVVHDDDVVEDIDAFRLRLAKKIDDFFERRKDDDFGAGIENAGTVAEGEPATG